MKLNVNWNVFTTGSAKRQLKRLPEPISQKLVAIFVSMKNEPFMGDAIKLGGKDNEWRRRVGEYRFKFKVFQKDHAIHIYEIERRTSSTY